MFIRMETGRVVDFTEVREFFIQSFGKDKFSEVKVHQVMGKYKNGDHVGLSNFSEDIIKTRLYKEKLEEKLGVVSL